MNQISLDEQLELIVRKLEEMYDIGPCWVHSDMRCYQYKPKDWHFELDANRLKVWANAIVSSIKTNCEV